MQTHILSWTLVALWIGSLSAAAPQDQGQESPIKNVLFLISDDLKASVLGCYGDPICQTPNIDRLAREGMLFERAYCQGTTCAPSRRSFMFSRYRGTGPVNLGQQFREHGWYSARVSKIYHMRVPGDIIGGTDGQDVPSSWTERFNSPGLEAHTPGHYACLNQDVFTTDLNRRESTGMKHRPYVTVRYEGDGSDQPDHKSATKAIELLDQHRDEPFFLAVGFVRPHYPMVAPQQYFDPYPWQEVTLPETMPNDEDDIPRIGLASSRSRTNGLARYPDNQKRMWSGYYAAVQFMDEQVGRILGHLDRLGLRDSTAVVFTSDHGYHLGEHDFWQKHDLHEEVTRVPLIISAPGFATGVHAAPVELVDLFPTLCELASLPVPKSVQGVSLVPALRDPDHHVRDAALTLLNGYSLRTKGWAYFRYRNGAQELYDMRRDPHQFTNLAEDASHAQKLAELDELLNERLRKAGLK